MQYALAVYSAPTSSQISLSAFRFAEAVIAKGHHLLRVFFYSDGIQNANCLTAPPQDEFDLVCAWQTLAKKHNIELIVCIAAALRRGVIDQTEADRYRKNGNNLAEGFSLGGLGQLLDAAVSADRFVTFGG